MIAKFAWMVRWRYVLPLGITLLSAASLPADELKSGPQPGEFVFAFDVEKAAGAADDGVPLGKTLCYRCRYGNRPVVAIFSSRVDDRLTSLVAMLDAFLAKHQDEEVAAYVILVGEDRDTLKLAARSLAQTSAAKRIPLVIPGAKRAGWKDLNLHPKAELTALLFRKGKVAASHALAPGKLDEQAIEAILADAQKLIE